VKVYSPVKKVMFDYDKFISEFGVLPENFRLVKALTGDDSDNIEGIKGFGVKTIAKSFPFLVERKVTADEVLEEAEELGGVLGKRLLEAKTRFLENLRLVDLSDPMLSATAARIARENLRRDLGCKEVDFRMRVLKEGISFTGNDFTGVFRDFVLRRRKLLSSIPVSEEIDGQVEEAGQQLPGAEGGE
jgi:5'-3' exonuclease